MVRPGKPQQYRGGILVHGGINDEEDAELVTAASFIAGSTQASADSALRAETTQRLSPTGKVRANDQT